MHIVIPVMFAYVTTSLLPSRAAANRCAASCSQTLKTTASRKEQVAATISVRCHTRPASLALCSHRSNDMRGCHSIQMQWGGTPNCEEVSEVPRAPLQVQADGLCSRSGHLPASEDPAYESANVPSEKQKGALPSVSTKDKVLSKPRVGS